MTMHWVFVAACRPFAAAHGPSLVMLTGHYSPLRFMGFSLRWLLWLPSTGARHTGSVVLAGGLSCPLACGILVPRTEVKLVSPALAGRFLTTRPEGKSPKFNNY